MREDRDLRRFAEIIEQPHSALLFSRAFGGADPEWLKRVEKVHNAVDLITENLVQVVREDSPLRVYAAIGCLVALHYWRPSSEQFIAIVIAALIVRQRFVDGSTEDFDFVYGAESQRLLALLNKDVVLRYYSPKSEETVKVSELRSSPPIISDVLEAYNKSPGLLKVVGSDELQFKSFKEYSPALEFIKSKVLTVDRWYSKFGDKPDAATKEDDNSTKIGRPKSKETRGHKLMEFLRSNRSRDWSEWWGVRDLKHSWSDCEFSPDFSGVLREMRGNQSEFPELKAAMEGSVWKYCCVFTGT